MWGMKIHFSGVTQSLYYVWGWIGLGTTFSTLFTRMHFNQVKREVHSYVGQLSHHSVLNEHISSVAGDCQLGIVTLELSAWG